MCTTHTYCLDSGHRSLLEHQHLFWLLSNKFSTMWMEDFFNANLIMLKTLHWLFISSWIKTKSLNMAYKPQAGCHLPSFLTSLHVGPHISHYPSASLAFFSSLISCISTLPQDIIKISSAQLVLFSFPLNLSTLITFAVEPFLASNPLCLFGGPGQCTINSSCNYHSHTENLVSCLI